MTIFLIFAPFGSFALLMLVTSAQISLFASAAICLAVIAIDIYRGRSIKILAAGSVATFGADALETHVRACGWREIDINRARRCLKTEEK